MYPRFVESRVREALSDTRVVLLCGPRQAGKTTLASCIAGGDLPFLTLDDATVREAASNDPVGFVRDLDRAVIDEVQRAPDLMLAIKAAVDADPRPGRYLLTGSANLMTLPRVADSLAGRMAIIRLLPLAQSEIRETPSHFLARAFSGDVATATTAVLGELLKLASWAEDRYEFSHFRDKERNEVDIVIEDTRGRIVGVEVKASATVTERDFSGLRRLAAASGERFAMGIVLYDHDRTVPFGRRMAAAPVSSLWAAAAD